MPPFSNSPKKNLTAIKPEVKTSVIGAFSTRPYKDFDDDLPPFLVISEALEQDPIGRAVWMYIIGIIMGKADKAKEFLENVVKRYDETAAVIRNDEKYVYSIFYNAPFGSSWYQPLANQYTTEIGNDALTAYRYYDKEKRDNSSIAAIVEDFGSARMLLRASLFNLREVVGAGTIPTIDMFVNNASQIPSIREQLRSLRAIKCGNVWYSKRVRTDGADDLFGSAFFNPHLVLEDMRRVVHSADGEDIEDLIYFRKYRGTGGNCTYPKLGDKGENEQLRENSIKVNSTWYDFEGILPNLTEAMKEGGYPNFDVRWKKEDYDEEKNATVVTATIVAYSLAEDEDKFMNETKAIFVEVLRSTGINSTNSGSGSENDNGNSDGGGSDGGSGDEGDTSSRSSGVGAGGIAGMVIAAVVVLAVVVVVVVIKFRPSNQPTTEAMRGD